VLIASGYRNSDLIDYSNPRVRWMYYLAAGGAACLVQRDCPKNQILEAHFMSDGSYAGDAYVPAGGSAQPMTLEALHQHWQYLDVFDPEGMKARLEQNSLSNWLLCIDKALEKSGYTREDVDYLATLLIKRSAHDYLVGQLGLEPHQTRYFEEFGHHGQNDQILSLELAIEEGRIKGLNPFKRSARGCFTVTGSGDGEGAFLTRRPLLTFYRTAGTHTVN
jgi:3-oxoacyl-[acyl-carrier-protein] synthase-3